MTSECSFAVRVARPDDRDAVDELLAACYPPLLAPAYAPEILVAALPAMTRANPSLLSCGTWYVAEDADGALVGCGGFTAERPGTAETEPGLGHLRHFGTHPDHLRRGIARATVRRCAAESRGRGIERFECYSTFVAEPFYASLGLERVEVFELPIPILGRPGETIGVPSVRMRGILRM